LLYDGKQLLPVRWSITTQVTMPKTIVMNKYAFYFLILFLFILTVKLNYSQLNSANFT